MTPDSAGRWVLVVEDDAPTRSLYRQVLEGEIQLAVIEAEDAQVALNTLDKATSMPALVLVDLMLPGVAGETLMRAIRHRFGPDLPIMLSSATSEDEAGRIAAKVDAQARVSKPFELDEFIREVQRVIGER